ncbi:MAG: hypothetical protein J0H74_35305 [Chitinophagaceae bacterium]|nr:hypothetical protein [Chitinophagaceae bacterium]
MRIACLFLLVIAVFIARAQKLPSNEEFVNETIKTYDSKGPSSYYLVAGADTCRFEKFDYDEWVKYHLQETVPLVTLNELAYKAHMAREPYYWKQDKLKKAICISAKTADSLIDLPVRLGKEIFSLSQPFFTDDGQYAVMDVNMIGKPGTGGGLTFLYRHKKDGWHVVGAKQNWGPGGIMKSPSIGSHTLP